MRSRDPLRRPEPLIRAVYAYVAYRIGPGADAEDLTSDVFERALRYRESFDPRKGTPTAWLIGIARRCVDGHLGGGRLRFPWKTQSRYPRWTTSKSPPYGS